jgi:hypothetical protein
MSMEHIRKHYGVPAKRGGKVRFTPDGNRHLAHEGVIVGSRGAYLKIRMGDEKTCRYLSPNVRHRIPVSHITIFIRHFLKKY